ncbi:hypothetical protein BP5796_04386 [Coleophoma crateriformis]|uniref:Major facilitator superfamily (MFS) profile domain-containing protein n=1 Tax=Coleophoma crateriformis TaxID=565419 RepID=A0A3D8S960_9HELO|nr:hypothetical protein BP5796_04386 [Coleophoma crateriformis]
MASTGLRQCVRDVTPYLLLLILVSTLGPLQFGFHLAELNSPQDVITCKKKSIWRSDMARSSTSNLPQCIPMTAAEFAAISSVFTIGGLLGALCAGPVSDAYGRLLAMRINACFFVLGAILETLSGNILILGIGRLLAGVGAGASTVIVPLYVSEIAPPAERGLFGSLTQVMINVGILVTQTLGYYLSRGSMWRIILAVGFGIGVVQAFGLLIIPESPAWLAAHKHPQKAIHVLQRIRGAGRSINHEIEGWDIPTAAEEEHLLSEPPSPTERRDSIVSKTSQKSVANIGFFQVFRDPLYQPAIIAVVGIMFAQQLCGINSIMMYSVSLLSGVLPIPSSLLTIMISIINLLTTIACAPLADKIGRKSCLLLSISGMGTMSFALAMAMRFEIKILSAISVILFVAFFATGLGPVPFMMASELVGQEAVGATQSWSLGSNYVATFLVAQFFPIINQKLNETFGGKGLVFFVFAGLALLSAIFVAWRVPETKGKKDADEVWGRTRRVD